MPLNLTGSVFYKHWKEVPASIWRWDSFKPQEIACNSDGSILIDFEAMDKLQRARILAGKPFYINSAYRSVEHNHRVGGKPNSLHLKGKAFDISLRNFKKDELHKVLVKAGFTGFGLTYSDFIHADTGRKRTW